MMFEKVDLYRYFGMERGTKTGGFLTVCARSQSNELRKKIRPAVLVIPGGAYLGVSDREGEPVALRFVAEGYAAFTLSYTVQTPYPTPLVEGAMAMAYIRRECKTYGVDPHQVCVIGFSAGGHLAGMLTAMYGEAPVRALFGEEEVRPDASALSYAVLATDGDTHPLTEEIISGGDKELAKALSVVDRLSPACPPVFLWHTADDDCVPAENSLRAACKLAACKAPYELHIFAHGEHGLSLCDDETSDGEGDSRLAPDVGMWVPLLFRWLRGLGFKVRCE